MISPDQQSPVLRADPHPLTAPPGAVAVTLLVVTRVGQATFCEEFSEQQKTPTGPRVAAVGVFLREQCERQPAFTFARARRLGFACFRVISGAACSTTCFEP